MRFLMSTIDARWAERPAGAESPARRYRDLVIDGVPVSSLLRGDVISPFGWGSSDDEKRAAAARLLGRAAPNPPHGVSVGCCSATIQVR